MKLGIMQPYFFPYIGHFSLISSCDKYIIFDISQYTPRTWMNRNRILKPHTSKDVWQYITVAVEKCSRRTPLNEVVIKDKSNSLEEILRQIEHYKKYAPFYNEVKNIILECFENTKTNLLFDLNVQSLKSACKYLDINFKPFIFSEEKIDLPEINYPGQWALEIATYYKADSYLNPPAGKGIFRKEEFIKRGIELSFLDMPTIEYSCKPYGFEPYLSILDVLMWNDKVVVQKYLKQ